MSLSKPRLFRETLAAATAFHERALWREYGAQECFAVVLPGMEHPMIASIMGQGGEEFGLMMMCGERACDHMLTLVESDETDDDLSDAFDILGFSMTRLGQIPTERQEIFRTARFRGGRSTLVPDFVVKRPHQHAKPTLNRTMAETFLAIINGILTAYDRGELDARPLEPGSELPALRISGDPLAPDVVIESIPCRVSSARRPAPASAPDGLGRLPRLAERWLVGLPALPVAIANDARTLRGLLVVDERSRYVLDCQMIPSDELDTAARLLFDTFRGHNAAEVRGLPAELVVSSRALYDAVRPVLAPLGVTVTCQARLPVLDEIVRDFAQFQAGERDLDSADAETESSGGLDVVPAPDDLAGWKRADRLLYESLDRWWATSGRSPDRAARRYFGDPEAVARFLKPGPDPLAATAFLDWLVFFYRPTRRSKTVAETIPDGDLPIAQAALLRAAMDSYPSLYRVERIEKGRSLTLVDVFGGEEVVVDDKGMSESAEVGFGIPLHTYPAGQFRFATILGRPLDSFDLLHAVEFLMEQGLEPTPEGLRRGAHLFGRLWAWGDRRREAGPPTLVNTDDETLTFCTATYAVQDEAGVRTVLESRDDIDADDDRLTFIWFREGADRLLPGQRTLLGRLQLVGEELIVETNSVQRMSRARRWLDPVPGLTFRGIRERSVEDALDDGVPLDDQPSAAEQAPLPPEMQAVVERMLRQQYMKWLDEPIPALGGRTPRQACRTPEGRAHVGALVRTMPDPEGPGSVPVPRSALLRELGLDRP